MKSTNSFGSLAVAACLTVSSLFSGCSGSAKKEATTTIETPEKGDWIIVHQLSDVEGLNPVTTNDAGSRDIYVKIYEPMLELDFATAELKPCLAVARPEISADHLTYTFKLHNNIIFSDGKPLTAKDVVFSFKAVKNPLVIDGASLRNYFLDVQDVKALDDYTIQISMAKPFFLAEYFLGGVYIMPKHILDPENLTDQFTIPQTNDIDKANNNVAMKKFAEWFGTAERKRDGKFLIGSGPYIFEEWRTNEFVKLYRNEKYWNPSNPDKASYPNKLVFKTINDRPAAISSLKNQDIDFISYVPPILFGEIDTVSTPHLKTTSYPIPTYMYIGWNMRKPIFADKRVRQALSHLVDKNVLIKNVMRGFGVPTESSVYQGLPEYDSTLKPYSYDPAKATALLAEAGWKDSDGDGILDKIIDGKKTDFRFTFLLNAGNETRENIVLVLIDEFKKIGIKAEVQKLEWSIWLENVRTHQFDATIGAWVNDPTPPDEYQLWHSSQAVGKGSNYCGFINKRADELIELNRIEFDAAKRKEYLKEFQQLLYDEQPYTFLWLMKYPTAYNARLRNVKFYPVRPGYNVNSWFVPKSLQKFQMQ